MNESKPIFESRTIFTILLALLVPEVIDVIGLKWIPDVFELIRLSIGDYVLTMDELIRIGLSLLAIVFRAKATTTLTIPRIKFLKLRGKSSEK